MSNDQINTMTWDLPDPFTIDIEVGPQHVDVLGHVNHAVYVQWLEACSWQHISHLGLGVEDLLAMDHAFAVFQNNLSYLASAYLGERITVATWIVGSALRLKLNRHYQVVRQSDQTTLLRADTVFACIEVSTGKAKKMPPSLVETLKPALRSEIQ